MTKKPAAKKTAKKAAKKSTKTATKKSTKSATKQKIEKLTAESGEKYILGPEDGWRVSVYESGARRKISPSALGTFNNCEYLFYLKYFKGIKEPQNKHMARGTAVHTVLEKIYDNEPANIEKLLLDAKNIFEETWASMPILKDEHFMKEESWVGIRWFVERVQWNYKRLSEKYKDKPYMKVWKMVRPQTEKRYDNKEYGAMGIVDRVEEVNDNSFIVDSKTAVITDYKTSSIFKMAYSDEYKDQLMHYAWLYSIESGELPDFVSVDWILYGLQTFMPVVEADVLQVKEKVKQLHSKIIDEPAEENWTPNVNFKFCQKHCPMGKALTDADGNVLKNAPCAAGYEANKEEHRYRTLKLIGEGPVLNKGK